MTKDRRTFIGGSDANCLMSGSPERQQALLEEKRGEREPENLDWVLPVQIGKVTEDLNVKWFECKTARKVTERQAFVVSKSHVFMKCHLDGITVLPSDETPAIFEAKHVNAFSKLETVVQNYMPQLHHNGFCLGVDYAVLSVFIGTLEYHYREVELTDWYLAELIEREEAFWKCVQNGSPLPWFEPVEPPVPPEKYVTVDMTGKNSWTHYATDWLINRKPAKLFRDAEKGLKELVEPNVGLARGAGVQIKRTKAGALRISEEK